MKKSEIKFIVTLDEENIPEKIEWMAEDNINSGLSETKTISISLWDEKKNNTLRIDLWTKEMPIDEMKTFMLQTLQSMNQTISKAIGNENLIKIIDEFSQKFESKINQDTK